MATFQDKTGDEGLGERRANGEYAAMRQCKVAGFRWQVEMENPRIQLLLGENGLENQKASPVGVRCKIKWSVCLCGNTNLFSGQVIQKGIILYSDANLFSVRFTTE